VSGPEAGIGLGRRMVGGSVVMLARQVASASIGLLAVATITALIGPSGYGHFASAQALVLVAGALVPTGVAAALIRRSAEPEDLEWSAAAWLLLVAGCSAPLVLAGLGHVLGAWTGAGDLGLLTAVTAAAAPVAWPAQLAMARLERRLDYRRVATCELAGLVLFALAATAMAWGGLGAWSAALAFASQQVLVAVLATVAAGTMPRPHWHPAHCRELLRYTCGWATSAGAWQLRQLVNPIVVGASLGQAAVGQVALAVRIAETLAAAKGVAARVGPAGLAKVREERAQMRLLLARGMDLGVLAVGIPLSCAVALLVVFHPLIPEAWVGGATVFPSLAIAATVGGLAVLWSSVLLVEGCMLAVTVFHAAHVGVLALVAWYCVPHWGLAGYAVAEIAALSTFIIPFLLLRRLLGPVDISRPISNTVMFIGAQTASWWNPWTALLALIPIARPSSWRLVAEVRGARRE
jgi:O-antigen/teichoic acid export membrane protein